MKNIIVLHFNLHDTTEQAFLIQLTEKLKFPRTKFYDIRAVVVVSVGRAVASNTRGLRFESSHRQKFIYLLNFFYCQLCSEKTKIKKKRPGKFCDIEHRRYLAPNFLQEGKILGKQRLMLSSTPVKFNEVQKGKSGLLKMG